VKFTVQFPANSSGNYVWLARVLGTSSGLDVQALPFELRLAVRDLLRLMQACEGCPASEHLPCPLAGAD
jgi:hypothetical protein